MDEGKDTGNRGTRASWSDGHGSRTNGSPSPYFVGRSASKSRGNFSAMVAR